MARVPRQTSAQTVSRVASSASRRATRGVLVRQGLRALPWTAGAAAVVLVGTRVTASDPMPTPVWVVTLAGGAVGVAAVWGAARALRARCTARAAAVAIDERLGLRGALASALELGESEAAFDRLAVRRGERMAAEADWKPVIGNDSGRGLSRGVVGLAVLGASAFALPSGPWWSREDVVPVVATLEPEEAGIAAEAVAEAREIVESLDGQESAGLDAEASAALAELEHELRGGTASADTAREAAARVEERAEQLASRAREERAQADRELETIADRVDELPTESDDARELADRLAAGDLEGAESAARSLEEAMDRLDPAQRERVARDLDRLADAIDEAAAERAASDQAAGDPAAGDPASGGGDAERLPDSMSSAEDGVEDSGAERDPVSPRPDHPTTGRPKPDPPQP
ncbi:MAG: hypothetical protein AAFY58_00160, partial [Planctomycetota bacterium]